MKLFLELMELLTEEEAGAGIQPQMIRIEVASEEEAREKLASFETFFLGRKYKKQLHICGHPNIPCEVKEL